MLEHDPPDGDSEFATNSKPGEMTAPRWGVPDWRDESAYPDATTPLFEWRWQFLRRRPDYREYWLAHCKADYLRHCQFAEYMRRNGDPEYHTQEWYRGWTVSGGILGPDSSTLDPSFPRYRARGVFPPRGGDSSVWRSKYEDQQDADRAGLLSLEFDLKEPLAPQLERARQRLEMDQFEYLGENPQSGRAHVDKWPTYLRVIDARDDDQSWSVVGRSVLKITRNSPQAARQVWEQAQRLMFKVGA